MQMDDVDNMLVNEYRKIQRSLQQRTKFLEALQKRERPALYNKRYVAEFDFAAGDLEPQMKSFVIERNIQFFKCCSVSSSVTLTGVSAVTAAPVTFTATVDNRWRVFNFLWRIRDTSNDREWQNTYMPDPALGSGLVYDARLGAPLLLKGGSEISVDLKPISSRTGATVIGQLSSVSSYKIQVCFTGVEVTV
jgi:hypothetical protein